MNRLSHDEIFLGQAMLAGAGSSCSRRMVGCVLTNQHNHILAVGRNGVPSGFPHCIEVKCPGADLPSGTGLDECQAVHAEINAMVQCQDNSKVRTCYTTASPCIQCVKALLNTSCLEVIFFEEYPHKAAKEMWLAQNNHGANKLMGVSTYGIYKRVWRKVQTPFLIDLWKHLKEVRND